MVAVADSCHGTDSDAIIDAGRIRDSRSMDLCVCVCVCMYVCVCVCVCGWVDVVQLDR